MPRTLIQPPTQVVAKVISDAICPVLGKLESELGNSLPTVVTVWAPNMEGPKILATPAGVCSLDLRQQGDLRLSFRETAVEGRLLFFGEAIYSRALSPNTGFSGFEVKGEVKVGAGETIVTPGPWTIRYNIWDWRGWK
jgi:hypothetical protein